MLNSLGQPQSVLLLGGTSDIGLAAVERWADRGPLRVVLAGRPSPRRADAVTRLRQRGVVVVEVDFDAEQTERHPDVLDTCFAGGDVDVAVVAFGVLGDEEEAWHDHASATWHVRVNYLGAVSVGVLLADHLRSQGYGTIVALSSVAGERVRRSNFVYGSTKAGMDGFYLGLGDAVRDEGVTVCVVRPGFVHTKMTAGRSPAPLAVTADQVGDAVVRAVAAGDELVWVPAQLRPVMAGLRHVPRALFRKLPL